MIVAWWYVLSGQNSGVWKPSLFITLLGNVCFHSLNLLGSLDVEIFVPNREIISSVHPTNLKLCGYPGPLGSSGQGTSKQVVIMAEITDHNHQGEGQLLIHKRGRKQYGTWVMDLGIPCPVLMVNGYVLQSGPRKA